MAFSTQKDFLKIAFLDDHLDPICPAKACVRLKSYSSTADLRTFTMDVEKQAHFLNDLVACRTYKDTTPEKPAKGKSKKSSKGKKKSAPPSPKKECGISTPKFKKTNSYKQNDEVARQPSCPDPPIKESFQHSSISTVPSLPSTTADTCTYLVAPKSKGIPVPPPTTKMVSGESLSGKGSAQPPPCALAKSNVDPLKAKSTAPAPPSSPSSKTQQSLDGGKSCLSSKGDGSSVKGDGSSVKSKSSGPVSKGDYCSMISTIQYCTVDTMLNENVKLREKLKLSENALKSIRNENLKIKNIIETDRSCIPLIEKIFELKEDKKITSKDEKDLLKIEKQICSRIKKIDILEAENNSLREKINEISEYNNESQYDPDCLRDCIYELEEEIKRLRIKLITAKSGNSNKNDDLLNKLQSIQCEYDVNRKQLEKAIDLNDYNKVIQERNKLREQLNRMGNLEGKILKLKERANDADRLEIELRRIQYGALSSVKNISYETKNQMMNIEKLLMENEDLKRKIAYLETDCNECTRMRRLMDDLQRQIDSLNSVKTKNKELMAELRNAGSYLQRMSTIEQDLLVTKGELAGKEKIIKDYECQFNQLLQVIEELEGSDYTKTAVKDCHMKEVALATKATLEQIKLELEARGELQKTLKHTRETSEIQICSLCGQLEKYKKANMIMKQAFITIQLNFFKTLQDIGFQCSSTSSDVYRNDDEHLIEIINATEVDQICNELDHLRSEIFDERKKYEKDKIDLTRAGKDFEILKDKLDEESDKYRLQREKCKDLTKENMSLGGELEELQRKFVQNREALDRQKTALEEQKELLAEAKAELEKHRSDICKCNEKISNLDVENTTLKAEKREVLNKLNTANELLNQLEDKLKGLNFELENYKQKVQIDSCLEEELQNLRIEYECSKCEMEQIKEDLKSKDLQLLATSEKIEESQFCLERAKKEFCNKMSTLLEDNKILEMELMKSREDLEEMNKIICEIEGERNKTKLLESKLNEFDNQLQNAGKALVPSEYHSNIVDNIDTLKNALENEDVTIRSLYEELGKYKDKLKELKINYESEIKKNEKLNGDLIKIKEELRSYKNCNDGNNTESSLLKEEYRTLTQKNCNLENSLKKEKTLKEQVLMDLNKIKADLKKEILKNQDVSAKFSAMIQGLTKEKDKSLARLQNIHDEQIKELKNNHSRELHLLKLAGSKSKASTPRTPVSPIRLPPARKGLIEIPEKVHITNRSFKSERSQKLDTSPKKTSRIKLAESRKYNFEKSDKIETLQKLEEMEYDEEPDYYIKRTPTKTIPEDNGKKMSINNNEKVTEHRAFLTSSITDIHIESIKTADEKNIKPIYCETTKLQYICTKIIEHGIESLTLNEITYIHSEIYKAGLKYKSILTGFTAQKEKDKRCCKCSGFTCCLPDIPKEKEKKFVDKIMCLENEVQWARNVLQKIIQNDDKGQSSSSRRDQPYLRRMSSEQLTTANSRPEYNYLFENKLPETWSVVTPQNRRWFDYPTKER